MTNDEMASLSSASNLIVNDAPATANSPPLGDVMRTVGGIASTTKSTLVVSVPEGVVTEIFPLVAPVGTVAVILLPEITLSLASTPLNFTLVAPVKVVPLIVTTVPSRP